MVKKQVSCKSSRGGKHTVKSFALNFEDAFVFADEIVKLLVWVCDGSYLVSIIDMVAVIDESFQPVIITRRNDLPKPLEICGKFRILGETAAEAAKHTDDRR